LAALAASPCVDRVTLAGRNRASLDKWAADCSIVQETTAEPERLLDEQSIELIHVVLPHLLHAEWVQRALAAGKHVICEKPAGVSVADFDASVAESKANDRRLLVVMNQLYNPVHQRLRALVDEGAVGRPFLSVENAFSEHRRNYLSSEDWRNTRDRAGGGVLIDGGYHMVYRHLHTLAQWGQPRWVLADTPQLSAGETDRAEPDLGEDFVAVTVGFAERLRIQWAHGWTLRAAPDRRRQSFLAGSEGTLELTDDFEQPLVLLAAGGTRTSCEIAEGPRSGAETTHACLLDYLSAIQESREPAFGDLQLARLTLAVIEAAYRSGRTGEREAV
jgi:predicted dehydrogenase